MSTLLFVGSDEMTRGHLPTLQRQFRVELAATPPDAAAIVERERPAFVVMDLDGCAGAGPLVCAAAQRCDPPATVLVTTSDPLRVPDVIAAGCGSVLLKPFAANLLYARLGRLGRERALGARERRPVRNSKAPSRGTNRVWSDARCPHCKTAGATSFEFASHRRAWFACVACRKVWIGSRLEDF